MVLDQEMDRVILEVAADLKEISEDDKGKATHFATTGLKNIVYNFGGDFGLILSICSVVPISSPPMCSFILICPLKNDSYFSLSKFDQIRSLPTTSQPSLIS